MSITNYRHGRTFLKKRPEVPRETLSQSESGPFQGPGRGVKGTTKTSAINPAEEKGSPDKYISLYSCYSSPAAICDATKFRLYPDTKTLVSENAYR